MAIMSTISTANKGKPPLLLICMVGLPARGKSYISRKIKQYFNWLSIKTKVFNLGEYRRKMVEHYSDHSFFEPDNEKGMAIRDACLEEAFLDIGIWFSEGGNVAIIDATNTALDRRKHLCEHALEEKYHILFIESYCNEPEIINETIKEVKTKSPDYKGKTSYQIVQDFYARIKDYEKQYTPLDAENEPNISFVKIINAGKRVETHKLDSPLKNRITRYLLTIRLPRQTIYISRHGESTYNLEHRLGGDPGLSPQGEAYAKTLGKFMNNLQLPGLKVWTSTLRRTIDTAALINAPQERQPALNEILAGICDDMTFPEAKDKWPDMAEERTRNKLVFRYPGGESYQDVILRLQPLILEMEQENNLCIIAHRAVIRCLLAYFTEMPLDTMTDLYVPLHTLFKLTATSSGYEIKHIRFPISSEEIT